MTQPNIYDRPFSEEEHLKQQEKSMIYNMNMKGTSPHNFVCTFIFHISDFRSHRSIRHQHAHLTQMRSGFGLGKGFEEREARAHVIERHFARGLK